MLTDITFESSTTFSMYFKSRLEVGSSSRLALCVVPRVVFRIRITYCIMPMEMQFNLILIIFIADNLY